MRKCFFLVTLALLVLGQKPTATSPTLSTNATDTGENNIYISQLSGLGPTKPRTNLSVRVTVLTDDPGEMYIGGDGTWFGEPQPLLENVGPDTWQFDIRYSTDLDGYTCHNCQENTNNVLQGNTIYLQVFTCKSQVLTPMIGLKAKLKFPVSETSTFFENPPEIVITPNFDNLEGYVHSIKATHPILGERDIGIYLPPGYANKYKQFPVTIMPDVSPAVLLATKPLLDSWFTKSIRETVILGFGDYQARSDDLQELTRERVNLLTPVVGDMIVCKNGTYKSGGTWGGGADLLLDWLLGDILSQMKETWPDRLLTDRDNLGIVGYSLGGLFSCHAAWTRHQSISRAACESSSFWFPTKLSLSHTSHTFHFVNQTLKTFNQGRLPQRILVTVGADEGGSAHHMVDMAQLVVEEMVKLPVFRKNENIWLKVYPNTNHSIQSYIERLPYSLKTMWD